MLSRRLTSWPVVIIALALLGALALATCRPAAGRPSGNDATGLGAAGDGATPGDAVRRSSLARTIAWDDFVFDGWRFRYPPNRRLEPFGDPVVLREQFPYLGAAGFAAGAVVRPGADGYRLVIEEIPHDFSRTVVQIVIGGRGTGGCDAIGALATRCVDGTRPLMYTVSDRADVIEIFDLMVATASRQPGP